MTNKQVNILLLDFESSVQCIDRIKFILDQQQTVIPVSFEKSIFTDYTSSTGRSIVSFSGPKSNADARFNNEFLFEAYTVIVKALVNCSIDVDKLIMNVIYPDSLASRSDLLIRMLSEARPNDAIMRSHLNQVK